MAGGPARYRLSAIRHVVAQALDQGGEVGFFCGVVTGEGERGIEHRLHFVQIGNRLGLLFCVFNEVGAEFQARQHGAQVVADGGQHYGAVIDETAQALLHQIEGARRVAQFAGSLFGQSRRADIKTDPFRGIGKIAQGVCHAVDWPEQNNVD